MNVALSTIFLGKADPIACSSVDAEAEGGEDVRTPAFKVLFAGEPAVDSRTSASRIASGVADTTPAIGRPRSPAAFAPFVEVEPATGGNVRIENDPLVSRPTSASPRDEAVDRCGGTDGGTERRRDTASPIGLAVTTPDTGRDDAGRECGTGVSFAPPGIYKDVLWHGEHGTGTGDRAAAERTTDRSRDPRPGREDRERVEDSGPGEDDGGSGGVAACRRVDAPPEAIDATAAGPRFPEAIGNDDGATGAAEHKEGARRSRVDQPPRSPVMRPTAGPDDAASTFRLPADRAGAVAGIEAGVPVAHPATNVATETIEDVRRRPVPLRAREEGEDVVVARDARRSPDGETYPITLDELADRRPVRRTPSHEGRAAPNDARPRERNDAASTTTVPERADAAAAVPASSAAFHGDAIPATPSGEVVAPPGDVASAGRAAFAFEKTDARRPAPVGQPTRAPIVGEAVFRAAGGFAGEAGEDDATAAVPVARRAPDAGRSFEPSRATGTVAAETTVDAAPRHEAIVPGDEPSAPMLTVSAGTDVDDRPAIADEPAPPLVQASPSHPRAVAEASLVGAVAANPTTASPSPPPVATTPEVFSRADPPAPEQVAVRLTKAVHGGTTAVRMRLDPPELGAVEIRLEFHKDHLAAVISAERQETLDLLRRDAPVLERALREAGGASQGADLRFVHADGGQGQAEGRAPTNAFLRVPGSLAEDAGAETLLPAAFHQPVWSPGSSLDVRA